MDLHGGVAAVGGGRVVEIERLVAAVREAELRGRAVVERPEFDGAVGEMARLDVRRIRHDVEIIDDLLQSGGAGHGDAEIRKILRRRDERRDDRGGLVLLVRQFQRVADFFQCSVQHFGMVDLITILRPCEGIAFEDGFEFLRVHDERDEKHGGDDPFAFHGNLLVFCWDNGTIDCLCKDTKEKEICKTNGVSYSKEK